MHCRVPVSRKDHRLRNTLTSISSRGNAYLPVNPRDPIQQVGLEIACRSQEDQHTKAARAKLSLGRLD
eukprot:COSAG03_NODE_26978_length_256_cov_0.579618_1_plen_67_part_10